MNDSPQLHTASSSASGWTIQKVNMWIGVISMTMNATFWITNPDSKYRTVWVWCGLMGAICFFIGFMGHRHRPSNGEVRNAGPDCSERRGT